MTRSSIASIGGAATLLLTLVHASVAFEPMPDYPGPYCETSHKGCCNDRQDGCAVPISSE